MQEPHGNRLSWTSGMTMAVAYVIVPLLDGLFDGSDSNFKEDPKWIAICLHCRFFASYMLRSADNTLPTPPFLYHLSRSLTFIRRSFSVAQVVGLQSLQESVHKLLRKCWPRLLDMNKPHWDMHTPRKILELGPIWMMW